MCISVDVLKLVAIAAWMLVTGYPDIKDYFMSEIEKHPVPMKCIGKAGIQYQLTLARVFVAAT